MEPMRGIRIIEVTTNASGPLATGILADQGADVIRLETIGAGIRRGTWAARAAALAPTTRR